MRTPSINRLRMAVLSAFAMTISFGLAFAFHWEKPFWAAFAAMVISLSTIGQSIQKSLLRMAGTVVGAAGGLILLSLWGSSKWMLLTASGGLLCFLVLCMFRSYWNSYFYYTAALVSILVVAQGHGENPFLTSMFRVEENVLGIAVYSCCALIFWPTSSSQNLQDSLLRAVKYPYAIWKESTFSAQQYREAMDLLNTMAGQLPAARLESYENRITLPLWEEALFLCRELVQIQQQRILDLKIQQNNLRDRLWGERLKSLAEWDPKKRADKISVHHGHGDAVLQICDTLESVLEMLFDQANSRTKIFTKVGDPLHLRMAFEVMKPDLIKQMARVAAVFTAIVAVWMQFDPLGTYSTFFVEIGIMLGLVAFLSGRFSPWELLCSLTCGTVISLILFLMVLPELSSFVQLGPVLFILILPIFWLYYLPAQGLIRTGLLLPSFMLTGLEGEHIYAGAYLQGASTLMLCGGFISLLFYIIQEDNPEQTICQAYARFIRLADSSDRYREHRWIQQWMRYQLKELSIKIYRAAFMIREEKYELEPQSLKMLALACRRYTQTEEILSNTGKEARKVCDFYADRIDWNRLDIHRF